MALVDSFNRRIDYLRVSVTDRCNLRCKYCMPEGGITHRPPTELLSFEEIAQIVRVGVSLGIDKVRLTGGEPLVRKNIVDLVKILSSIRGLNDISMTTNGILLRNKVSDLKKAGLKRVNISLDSLNEERFKDISRGGELKEVTEAIKLSLEEGLSPLKINVLLLAGINEDEVNDFLRLAKEYPLHVRFMEFMPIRDSEFWDDGKNFMSCEDVMEIASQETLVEPIDVY
ncbi:MAG: radical SAM protein, partial [Candidatus Omnitrophota bacterium]|nr:radical SAM protein [Candidatus Omnitrophota bacterium]